MTFKQIIKAISEGTSKDELYGLINRAFDKDRITWADHEMLYRLVDRLADN